MIKDSVGAPFACMQKLYGRNVYQLQVLGFFS
jgi:hypothetical protein